MGIVLDIYDLYKPSGQDQKKYKIFRFKNKASVKEYVFWPNHIILYNTNNLAQLTNMFEIIK